MTLILNSRGISSFLGLKEYTKNTALRELVLQNNNLWSFESFGSHEHLRRLDLTGNKISSFLGMTKQRSLEELVLEGNPVTLHPHYRVMALLTIGFSLKLIDGKAVERFEIERARQLGPNAALAVSCGWKLDLAPRDDAEYHALIADLRSERRSLISKHAASPVVTIIDILETKRKPSEEATLPSSCALEHREKNVDDEVLQIHKRAVSHLSRRVASLENRLQLAEREAQVLRAQRITFASVPQQAPFTAPPILATNARTLSVGDALCPSSVEFGPLEIETNLSLFGRLDKSAFLHLTKTISVLTFFDRVKVIERPFPSLAEVSINIAKRWIQLQFADGLWLRIMGDNSETTLASLWRWLHIRWRKIPPEISGAEEAVEPKLEEPSRDKPHTVERPAMKTDPPNTSSMHIAEAGGSGEQSAKPSQNEVGDWPTSKEAQLLVPSVDSPAANKPANAVNSLYDPASSDSRDTEPDHRNRNENVREPEQVNATAAMPEKRSSGSDLRARNGVDVSATSQSSSSYVGAPVESTTVVQIAPSGPTPIAAKIPASVSVAGAIPDDAAPKPNIGFRARFDPSKYTLDTSSDSD